MSYKNKITNYQGDCPVELGRLKYFSDYIKEFSKRSELVMGQGLDIGAGPGGCNGHLFSNNVFDGCDLEEDVVNSLPKEYYNTRFIYKLGSQNLPYDNQSLDFVVCSCVIQHLKSFKELELAVKEMSRVLKTNSLLYLMFKVGSNDTDLTHFNSYYNEQRTFRVFHPDNVVALGNKYNLVIDSQEKLVDSNWIPYCCLIFKKN